jgi:hypothetical protein
MWIFGGAQKSEPIWITELLFYYGKFLALSTGEKPIKSISFANYPITVLAISKI